MLLSFPLSFSLLPWCVLFCSSCCRYWSRRCWYFDWFWCFRRARGFYDCGRGCCCSWWHSKRSKGSAGCASLKYKVSYMYCVENRNTRRMYLLSLKLKALCCWWKAEISSSQHKNNKVLSCWKYCEKKLNQRVNCWRLLLVYTKQ